eukprot:c16266_g1_i1.p1 GENE.c16266_g1_i1~~c16266_g1_i1.p1  ORF type:complete len:450 (+),score=87.40 c16266_g1_i1:66-1352(+)
MSASHAPSVAEKVGVSPVEVCQLLELLFTTNLRPVSVVSMLPQRLVSILGVQSSEPQTQGPAERKVLRVHTESTLHDAPRPERPTLLANILVKEVQKVSGRRLTPTLTEELFPNWLDSLAAVELRNRVRSELGITLPQTALLEHKTISSLVALLTPLIWRDSDEVSPPSSDTKPLAVLKNGARLLLSRPRPKVLFLHGFGSNAQNVSDMLCFKAWTTSLPFLDFVFIDAPHLILDAVGGDAQGAAKILEMTPGREFLPDVSEARAWGLVAFAQGEGVQTQTLDAATEPADGWLTVDSKPFFDSETFLLEVMATHGPFVGIGGFSEGAGMASRLLLRHRSDPAVAPVKFLLSLSPYAPDGHIDGAPAVNNIRALFLFGQQDDPSFLEYVRQDASRFSRSQIIEHEGGHTVPSVSAELQEHVRELVREVL